MFIFFSGAMVPPVGSVKNSCGNRSSIKNGLIEDHVWFEDRWMVASLCDE
jgi:hypothetical protein